jgi:hypothetical protein
MLHAILSSQLHMIFMPPVHLSISKVQRGTIIMLGAMAGVPMAGVFIAGMPMLAIPEFRSIIIALVIFRLLCLTGPSAPVIGLQILCTHQRGVRGDKYETIGKYCKLVNVEKWANTLVFVKFLVESLLN